MNTTLPGNRMSVDDGVKVRSLGKILISDNRVIKRKMLGDGGNVYREMHTHTRMAYKDE